MRAERLSVSLGTLVTVSAFERAQEVPASLAWRIWCSNDSEQAGFECALKRSGDCRGPNLDCRRPPIPSHTMRRCDLLVGGLRAPAQPAGRERAAGCYDSRCVDRY